MLQSYTALLNLMYVYVITQEISNDEATAILKSMQESLAKFVAPLQQ